MPPAKHSPEPWSLFEKGDCRDGRNNKCWIQSSDDTFVAETDYSDVPEQEAEQNAARIVACVNALQGYKTETLIAHAQSLLPIQLDTPDGDVMAQARAWSAVWKELWDAGMCSYIESKCGNGVTRAIDFIRHLKEKADAAR